MTSRPRHPADCVSSKRPFSGHSLSGLLNPLPGPAFLSRIYVRKSIVRHTVKLHRPDMLVGYARVSTEDQNLDLRRMPSSGRTVCSCANCSRLPTLEKRRSLLLLIMGQFGSAWSGRVIQGPALSGAPWMSGIEQLAEMITTDLEQRLPGQRKTQRDKLALLVATMLQVRSANLMDVAACLPRPAERLDSRYQWIKLFLANTHVVSDAVMAPSGREVLARLSAQGQTVVLLIDQTQVNERHQAVMVAVRLGGRALPLIWRVKETQGAIGFAEQRAALEAAARLLPAGAKPVLMGDRFYGSPNLIAWCRGQGWDWRLRLKQDLLVFEDGGETTLAACFRRGEHRLRNIELTEQRARTHVAMVHEAGHPEPWIIALSQPPSVHRAFDYGLRWGIEAMFSDFKTRGFNLEASQIERTDRLDRLVLVLALALYWAVSTGMWDAAHRPTGAEKNPATPDPEATPDPSPPCSSAGSGASTPAFI